jgi:hypothetical protein
MPAYSFSCQLSSITSMAQKGFDFNSWVYNGESKQKVKVVVSLTFCMLKLSL